MYLCPPYSWPLWPSLVIVFICACLLCIKFYWNSSLSENSNQPLPANFISQCKCTQHTSCFKWICIVFVILTSVSFVWEFMRLYQLELAKQIAITAQGMPPECQPDKMTLWQSLFSWVKSQFSWKHTPCEDYYKALLKDPFWEVSPTMVSSLWLDYSFQGIDLCHVCFRFLLAPWRVVWLTHWKFSAPPWEYVSQPSSMRYHQHGSRLSWQWCLQSFSSWSSCFATTRCRYPCYSDLAHTTLHQKWSLFILKIEHQSWNAELGDCSRDHERKSQLPECSFYLFKKQINHLILFCSWLPFIYMPANSVMPFNCGFVAFNMQ